MTGITFSIIVGFGVHIFLGCNQPYRHKVLDIRHSYTNIKIKQNHNHLIKIDRTAYTENIQLIPMTEKQINNPHPKVTEAKGSSIRNITGQLNWLTKTSRPKISYQVLNIISKITEAFLLYKRNK